MRESIELPWGLAMNNSFGAPDWRTLSQQDRDRAFNNGAAVPNSASLVDDWDERSLKLRSEHPETLNLAYGPRERNRIDFLKASEGRPTLLFIHGGYWQMRSKDTFTFCAAGPMAHGINVALMGYTLAPEASLDEIVAEIGAGIAYLVRELPALGGDPDRIIISGWSAGGHLAAMSVDHGSIRGGLLISGLYELEPIRHTYVNDKLRLDEEAARRNSPVLGSAGASVPLTVVAGSAELPLMRKQSADYAASRAAQGLPVAYEEIPGADHFTIMEELASPTGKLTEWVRRLA